MPRDTRFPDLGLFFGDQGGPGTGLPQTDQARRCPFLDQNMGEFCSLDGAMCPFVGFNYRKCKKYTNNVARGSLSTQGIESQVLPKKIGSPRVENALNEGKKGGPRLPLYESTEVKNASLAIGAALDQLFTYGLVTPQGNISPAGKEMAVAAANEFFDQGYLPEPPAPPPVKPGEFVAPTVPTAEAERYKKKLRAAKADFNNYNRKVLQVKFVGAKPQQINTALEQMFKIIHEVAMSRYHDPDLHANAQVNLMKRSRNNADATPGSRNGGKVTPPITASSADELMHALFAAFSSDEDIGSRETPSSAGNEKPHTAPHEVPDDMGFSDWDPAPPEEPEPVVSKKDIAKALAAEKKKEVEAEKQKAADAAVKKSSLGSRLKMKVTGKRPESSKGRRYKAVKHKSGFAQTGKSRTGVQFETWLMGLSPQSRELIFQGEERYDGSVQRAIDLAHELYDKNNTSDIEAMRSYLEQRLKAQESFEAKKQQFDRDLAENKRRVAQLPGVNMAELERMAHSPEQLTKTATLANKLTNRMFNIEAKALKIGNSTVTRFLKTAALPKLTRADYETMRMSEQAGLHAIQLQHQYGRKFGQWNTFVMALEDIFLPLGVLLWPGLGEARAGVLMALKSWFPRRDLIAFFHAFLQKPLPTMRGSDSMIPSKSTKFWGSQKMNQPGRAKTIMRGYDTDPAGIPTVDHAVLHTRAVPTTKKPWSKTRDKFWSARHKEAKARGDQSWDQSYL